MNMNADIWARKQADTYLRHGGKTSRRATVRRLIAIVRDIQQHEPGANRPEQIGRAHIHRYYARHENLAPSTIRDHYYAIRLLWDWLERPGQPPKPKK